MGTNSKANRDADARYARRGTLAGRLEAFGQRGAAGLVSWQGVSPERIHAAILEVTEEGGTIQFGKTRKGEALTVRVFAQGEAYTAYANDHIEAVAMLQTLCGEGADLS